jgi:hypothetical protein
MLLCLLNIGTKLFSRRFISSITCQAKFFRIKLLLNSCSKLHQIIHFFALLGVRFGLTFVLIINESFSFAPCNVFFLAIVVFTKATSVLIYLLGVSIFLAMSHSTSQFFLFPNYTLMPELYYVPKFSFYLLCYRILLFWIRKMKYAMIICLYLLIFLWMIVHRNHLLQEILPTPVNLAHDPMLLMLSVNLAPDLRDPPRPLPHSCHLVRGSLRTRHMELCLPLILPGPRPRPIAPGPCPAPIVRQLMPMMASRPTPTWHL